MGYFLVTERPKTMKISEQKSKTQTHQTPQITKEESIKATKINSESANMSQVDFLEKERTSEPSKQLGGFVFRKSDITASSAKDLKDLKDFDKDHPIGSIHFG